MTKTEMQIITFRLENRYVEELKRHGQRTDRSLSKTIRRILIDDLTRRIRLYQARRRPPLSIPPSVSGNPFCSRLHLRQSQ